MPCDAIRWVFRDTGGNKSYPAAVGSYLHKRDLFPESPKDETRTYTIGGTRHLFEDRMLPPRCRTRNALTLWGTQLAKCAGVQYMEILSIWRCVHCFRRWFRFRPPIGSRGLSQNFVLRLTGLQEIWVFGSDKQTIRGTFFS